MANQGTSPNIVIIITDQQNIDAISAHAKYFPDKAHGPKNLKTPNIDRMVRKGRSFILSHSANPVSCPARATLFTGHYSTEHGVTFNNVGIAETIPNLAQWLGEKSDYRCYYAGKWHAGGAWNYPAISGNRKIPGFTTIPIGDFGLGEHNDYQVSTAVQSFLNADQDGSPFLVVAGLMNPHDICYWIPVLRGASLTATCEVDTIASSYPELPPNRNYTFKEPARLAQTRQKQSDLFWKNYSYDYYRMVEKADLDIGRILDAVDARNDNTIIIFTADHGEGLGRHGRVQKWHPYDQSVRVPLIFYGPGVQPGFDAENLVSGVDIFPTVCAMAGVEAPQEVNGVNLMPIITGEKSELERDHIFMEFMNTGRVVRDKKYKYIKMYVFSGNTDQPFVRTDTGGKEAFNPKNRALYKVDPCKLLFDMEQDPWEQNNLAEKKEYATEIALMEQRLSEWEEDLKPGVHFDRN